MGIFGNSSPFDQDVERATSENNTSEEWGLILEICDRAGASAQASRDCLRAILRRLGHPDPHVQVHAATLLDACVANCGRIFHLEVASRDFETEYRRLISRAQPAVAQRLRALLRKWAEGEFKSDPQLDLIPALAKQLRAEADRDPTAHAQASASAAAAAAQREQEELARAIAISLRETGPPATSASSTLYPRVEDAAGTPAPQPAKKVRALYDFEAAEDNELTFLAGEIVHVTDASDPNWWKGYNERGEGLFPANFVTADLTEPPPPPGNEVRGAKSVQFTESVGGVSSVEEPAEIDESAMDAALAMLHEADVEARSDESALQALESRVVRMRPQVDAALERVDTRHARLTQLPAELSALQALESRVVRMGPLVDAALERADTRHARLTQLSAELVRALNLYHELMREPRPALLAGPPPPPPPFHPQQPYVHPPPPRC